MRTAAVVAAVVLVGVLFTALSPRSRKVRSLTRGGYCMGLPVYAGAFGPLVGFLIGPATVAGQAGAVPAIDISVFVDGAVRSVWRRESEVRTWYAPMDIISARECQWKRPGINWGRWEPTPLELGLDVRLWHRRFRRGWSTHHGLFAGGPPI